MYISHYTDIVLYKEDQLLCICTFWSIRAQLSAGFCYFF